MTSAPATRLRSATLAAAVTLLTLLAGPALSVEGMWTPDQLPEVEVDMRRLGLRLAADSLTDLTAFPFGAVISLGGCTASFVSPEGLVVTNHHCARGSVQFNSTSEHNYLVTGFVAATRAEELRTPPGTRVYVTTRVTDVTLPVTGGLTPDGLTRGIVNPSYLAFGPRGRSLYAVNELKSYDDRPSGTISAKAARNSIVTCRRTLVALKLWV